ncbi:Uma2 family endonuclease [Argonema antarcticum]|uniref:Uma2 family endonuclease n=1 Tax=Argonema antarcticum TaxID=2942763 RepID=UPI002012EDAD|nr:Uma2 family endonuclease [Argonema antarcticum]MCL1470768.1 Uma2 family endonuclease [Argonema antarcticum A004/B2]
MTTSISTTSQISSTSVLKWEPATWEDYLRYRDDPNPEIVRLFFNGDSLFVDMGKEGINHASVARLFAMLFFIWFNRFSDLTVSDLGGCLIEKPKKQAASPDLVLYIGEGVPQWETGKSRYIDLNKWRVPDLVGEISDTTLASDLDEKKKIYADLEIPEYWVIDVLGKRVIVFRLQSNGIYQQIFQSVALNNLPIALLEETLHRLNEGTNISAASWFGQQIANLNVE